MFCVGVCLLLEKASCCALRKNKNKSGLYSRPLFLLHFLERFFLSELQAVQVQHFMSCSELSTVASEPWKTLPTTPLLSLPFCSLICSILSLQELQLPRDHSPSFASSCSLCNSFLQAQLQQGQKKPLPISQNSPLIQVHKTNKQPQTNETKQNKTNKLKT